LVEVTADTSDHRTPEPGYQNVKRHLLMKLFLYNKNC